MMILIFFFMIFFNYSFGRANPSPHVLCEKPGLNILLYFRKIYHPVSEISINAYFSFTSFISTCFLFYIYRINGIFTIFSVPMTVIQHLLAKQHLAALYIVFKSIFSVVFYAKILMYLH